MADSNTSLYQQESIIVRNLAVIALLAVAPSAFAGNLYVVASVGQSDAALDPILLR